MSLQKYDSILTDETKKQILLDYTENFLSINKIQEKYGIKSYSYVKNLIGNKVRTLSEAVKNAHKLYTEKFKHSEETKKVLSVKQKEYIKSNTKEFSERLKRKTSYPEKVFIDFLNKYEYDKKYLIEREYSVYPYFIDFAFVDKKLAVEIDGSQHLLQERKESDAKKDRLLIENGWKVLRFSESTVKNDWDLIHDKINEFISIDDTKYEKVGIVHALKKREVKKVDKPNKFGDLSNALFSSKQIEKFLNSRKVERPSKDILYKDIKTLPFVKVGEKYGVSDRCISKWCKFYGLPSTKKEILKQNYQDT